MKHQSIAINPEVTSNIGSPVMMKDRRIDVYYPGVAYCSLHSSFITGLAQKGDRAAQLELIRRIQDM